MTANNINDIVALGKCYQEAQAILVLAEEHRQIRRTRNLHSDLDERIVKIEDAARRIIAEVNSSNQ